MPDREPRTVFFTSHFLVLIGTRELGFPEVGRPSSQTGVRLPPPGRMHRFGTVVLR